LTRPEPFEQAFGANAHPFESATADPAHLSDEFADGEEIEETAENPAKPGSGSEPEREAVALPPATAPAPATIDTSAAQQAVDPAAAPISTPRADTASSPGADSDAAASLDQHRPAEPHIVEPQSGSADASVAASDDPSDAADDHHQ
jgi:hypothetical protein